MGLTPPDSITSVHWEIRSESASLQDDQGSRTRFASQELAEEYIRVHQPPGQAVRVEYTYRVGDDVWVRTYGHWRPGKITVLRMKRITVTYTSNERGDWNSRNFEVLNMRPRESATQAGGDHDTGHDRS